jgi:hypothetical protein
MHLALTFLVWRGPRTNFDVEMMIAVSEAMLARMSNTADPAMGQDLVSHYGLGQSLLFLPAVALASQC